MDLSTNNGTEQETEAVRQLKRILGRHDLSKWTFTAVVRIDAQDIPHGHPVLTMNANYLDKDELVLAVLLHEKIHWHLSAHIEVTKKAIAEFRRIYPAVPSAPPEGVRDESSTYLHLIVNYLEYLALQQILGEDDARSILVVASEALPVDIRKSVRRYQRNRLGGHEFRASNLANLVLQAGRLASRYGDMNESGSGFSSDPSPSQVPCLRTKTHQSTRN